MMVDSGDLNRDHALRVEAFARKNASILKILTQEVLGRFGPPPLSERRIVGIAGPGSVGKSTLAEVLVGRLRSRLGYDCDWLDLDGYLIEKALRESSHPIISGYNPEGYELREARTQLESWLSTGEPLEVRVYDKLTSKRTARREVRARDLLVFEGACAFCEGVRDLSCLKIFLRASREVQYANRWQRERHDLGLSESQIEEKFRTLYPDYENHILPTMAMADLILGVQPGYRLLYEGRGGGC